MSKRVVDEFDYIEWLYDFIRDNEHFNDPYYDKLLIHMYQTDFYYLISMDMDENRAMDGVELRYRYGLEKGFSEDEISTQLDDHPCNVLEMMIALADRCEIHIMSDPDIGDRTAVWFWDMVVSLGLDWFNDDNYDYWEVARILKAFMDRKYEPNGKGGLFTIEDCKEDLRDVEIWYQMCWYLNSVV